jgi:integrase
MKTRTGYLIKRGSVYYAAWTVSGKKFMRSTHQRDRRKAQTELSRIMQPFLVEDETRTLESIKARIEGGRAELVKLEEERNPPLTVAAAWNRYLATTTRPDSGEKTLSDYAGHFRAFENWLKNTHPQAVRLRDVTPAIAEQYAEHLKGRGLVPSSFNKHVAVLRLAFRVLKLQARMDADPWGEVQRKKVVSQSRRELTTDELRTVCAATTGEMRLLFAIGIYTGLRLADCVLLRWAEVDLRRGIIRRITRKTARRNQRPVVIPIHFTLRGVLEEITASERGEYVLPETAALYLRDGSAVSKLIQAHFKACGVKTHRPGTGFVTEIGADVKPVEKYTGKRAVVEVGFHSLRHTFVSLCRAAGAPLAVVEAIVGHSSPAMTQHYTHVSETAAAHAVNGLPVLLGEAADSPALSRDDQLRKIIGRMTPKKLRAEALALLVGQM